MISQPIFRFLGVVFDEDHDFEGPRAPKAHLDTVNRNLLHYLGRPFKWDRFISAPAPTVSSPLQTNLIAKGQQMGLSTRHRAPRGSLNMKFRDQLSLSV